MRLTSSGEVIRLAEQVVRLLIQAYAAPVKTFDEFQEFIRGLKVKVSVRDLPFFRDPTVIMIDQLKEVYIDGELEMIDTMNWLPKVMRKDYTVGLSPVGGGPDPDQNLYLNYGCRGELNYNGYCNPEVDKLIDRQSAGADQEGARNWCGRSRED